METACISFSSIAFDALPQLAEKDRAYATLDPRYAPYYSFAPLLESFEQAINTRRRFPIDRALLVETWAEQYARIGAKPEALAPLLDDDTYTIVTAHQPSLLMGPLYYVYKALSAIQLARRVSAQTGKTVLPVFVIGGEDHDFEEINHVQLFNETLRWEAEAGGPVGQLPSASLGPILATLREKLGSGPEAAELLGIFEDSFGRHADYASAVQHSMWRLFGQLGLLVLNMSAPAFKRRFAPLMWAELSEQRSAPIVRATQAKLAQEGFSEQAFVRDVNLFYVRPGFRERIEREADGGFVVLNSDWRFSEAEMKAELEAHPERFSPNVVMRPLYQEHILPNLAYVGGGGELAYWLERKKQFEAFGVFYPILVRRDSALWIDAPSWRKMQKLGLGPEDLCLDTESLIKQFLHRQADGELQLDAEKAELAALFERIKARAIAIDPTLEKAVEADMQRQINTLEALEKRLIKAEKRQQESSVNQIRSLRERLFPKDGLQERHDSFIPFYLKHGKAWFDVLLAHFDPLNPVLKVFVEDDK